MNIIITAFNNSRVTDDMYHAGKRIFKELPDTFQNIKLKKVLLPLSFNLCFKELEKHIDDDTKAIISLGSAGGHHFSIERVAINIMNSNGVDNNDYQPQDEKIDKKGKNAYFSNLNIRGIEQVLKQAELPAVISNSAGVALCNNILYLVAQYNDQTNKDMQYGFIHIPHIDHEKNKNYFTLPLDLLYKGIQIVLSETIKSLT